MRRRVAALAVALVGAGAGPGRAQPNPGGRWLTLETAHFHVHVRAEAAALGRRAAAEAEAVYAALAAELVPPAGRIELVIADNVDFTNGDATVYPRPAALVYAAPPVGDIELAPYDSWLHLGLAHELAHVFDLDLARGWWRLARRVFGRMPALFPNLYAPDWLLEGIAVYYETRLTPGGRLRGSYHGALLAAQDAELGPLPADAALGLGPRWPAGLRPYAFGSRFLASVAAASGDSLVPRLIRETAGRPIPYLGLNGALRAVSGTSMLAAWRAWQDSLATPAAGWRARPAGGAVLLRGLRQAVAPRVAPDGRRLLFVDDRGKDEARLAVLERGSGRVWRLSRLNGEAGLSWDAGRSGGAGAGAAAVVSQLDLSDPYTARSDLWEVDEDGAERRLTAGARLRDPDVAPDGDIVATQLLAGGTQLVRRDSTGLAVLTAPEVGVEWAQARVAPDGRHIAAVRARDGRHEIVLLARTGAVERDVTRDAAANRMPAFSPDGRWLFWSSDRGGSSQLYATRADTTDAVPWRVTAEPFGAYAPAPASDSVFYLALHHDGFSLAAVALDTARWSREPADTGPAPPAAGFEAGADSVVRSEHPYRPWRSLLPQYWLPIARFAPGAAWIGALTSGQDALGRHAYVATLSWGTGVASGTWLGSLAYDYAGQVPWLLDASYSRSPVVVDTLGLTGGGRACCRSDEDATLGLTWRHPRWRTQVASRLGVEYERRGSVRRAGPVLSASATHVTEPAFAISPQNGWSVAAAARERRRTDGPLEYHEALATAAVYRALPVDGFARPVVAARAGAGWLGGSDRVVYSVGGISEGELALIPGITLGGGRRTFPVRGYGADAILGRSAVAGSLEVRWPLALVGRGPGLLPVNLDRLSAAAFADGGAAWFPRGFTTLVPLSSRIGSVGLELAADLGAPYDFPLRLRFGVARPLTAGTSPSAYVAIGPSF